MEKIGELRMKKVILSVLSVMILVFGLSLNTKATEFEGKEDYYNGICNGYIALNSPNRKVCEEYKQYLVNKKNTASQRLEQIKADIAASAAKLSSMQAISRELSAKMEGIYAELERSEAQIASISDGILKAEDSIIQKQEASEKRKQIILDRIPDLAVKANTNQYIDFIMGASDLVELIQRSSSIEAFTKYDKEMIETYQKELKELKAEREEQFRLKEQLEVYQEDLKLQEEELEFLYEENKILLAAYEQQHEAEMAKKIEAERQMQIANAAANRINFNEPMVGSSGMIDPLPWAYKSAGTWAYPSGGLHRGIDKATGIGTQVLAPANGIVLSATTYVNSSGGGYLGNNAGYPYGGGNTLHILVEAGGQVYGVSFMHLSPMVVSKGQRFSQGQVIALTGNTGNSTGPHCHIEVYRLDMSFQEALNYWNRNFDWAWGCGWSSGAACSGVGCRIRPESLGW